MDDVLDTYRPLLSRPGAKQFAFAGLLSRLPISMFNISVILMTQIQYDSWEIAGRVAAVGVVMWAIQTMPTARLVDRYGQRMMWPLTVAFVVGVVVLIATAMNTGPEWLLWVGVIIASWSGPLGSLTRARWAHLLDNDDDIHSAFALEGALDEVLFVGGPALSTLLAYAVHPAAGLVVATVGMVVGIALLLAQKSSEPPARRDTGGTALGRNVPKAIIGTAITAIALGSLFGSLDISTVAFAEDAGYAAAGGVVLGIISLGSFVGGLLYGSRRWTTPLWKRFLVASAILGVGFAILGQMPNLWWFTGFGFLAGMAIAPVLTSEDSIAQRVVPQHQLVEGMAWLRIGMGAGVAAGAWIGGWLIDHYGHGAGVSVMVGSAVLLTLSSLAVTPWVKRDTLAAEASRAEDQAVAPGHSPVEVLDAGDQLYTSGPPAPPGA
jgi:MFS family permease